MTDLPRLARSRPAPAPGLVHLGLGAFFRAHGALVIEEAVAQNGGDWGITGVSLRAPGIRDSLAPQDWTYWAVEMGPDGQCERQIQVLHDVCFAPEDPSALLTRLADPPTRLVSLTVTEKGYCYVPSTGALDLDHPDIQHDLHHPDAPRSAIGYLVRALQFRQRAGHRPFTVMSCDNLPNNGRIVRRVVLSLAEVIDPNLAEWIAAEGAFPATMVDRIVPATTPDSIAALARRTGRRDAAPVFHEPYLQWVIEDQFVDDARPAFEVVHGVDMVSDVTPFEHMKLRMLNGTHSALAYLGYLAGHQTIAETVADPVFAAYVRRLWSEEIIPTLTPPDGVDLSHYAAQLFERYANPAIQHRTWQIAMDGSQKLPQRLLGPLAEATTLPKGLCLAVAGWMRYVGGQDEAGQPIDVRDPLADRLRAISDSAARPAAQAAALLSVEEIFGTALPPDLRGALIDAYTGLVARGARASVAAL